jgi:hypothetical protein
MIIVQILETNPAEIIYFKTLCNLSLQVPETPIWLQAETDIFISKSGFNSEGTSIS